jgi:hypothetical protein
MAELRIEDNELALYLSAAEKVGAVHGDLRVPLSAVRRVDVLADAHGPADHGIKLGTRIPGRTEVGTIRGDGRNIFAAVLPGTPRGLRSCSTGRSTTNGSSAAPTRNRWPARSRPGRHRRLRDRLDHPLSSRAAIRARVGFVPSAVGTSAVRTSAVGASAVGTSVLL